MHIPDPVRRFALPAATAVALSIFLVACGGGASAGWTYAPLGPTADPNASPTAGPSGTPGNGTGDTIQITTTEANSLGFEPANPQMPAGTDVTVDYQNDSTLPHNIEFFAGADASSESLGKSDDAQAGDLVSVTFTTPAEPGDYYFWCAIHGTSMQGTYTVQ